MNRHSPEPEHEAARSTVPLDQLLGRRVLGLNHQAVGRLEEFRVEKTGREYVVTEFVIGAGGLLERLGLGLRLLLGRQVTGHVARWDQIDIADPKRPRLRCALAELRRT